MNWIRRILLAASTPSCPSCGASMQLRMNRVRNEQFWGCSRYPNCRGSSVYTPPQAQQQQQPQQQRQPAPIAPKAPGQQPNWYNNNVKKNWVLVESIPEGRPMVMSKGENGGWNWKDEAGQSGYFDVNSVKAKVKSVKDASNSIVQGFDETALFAKFKELRPAAVDPATDQAQPAIDPNAPKVPGRIPQERISEHQKAVQDSFLNTDKSIMINALAGSGKTTMLRHLASFKDPKGKWLYLVFNKKNQVEASTGKGKFPNNVEVMTSHSFLGRHVLGKSAEMNLTQGTDLWNQRGERIGAILDHMMENDQTFPRSLKFAAMKVIKQLGSLSKAFAVNPKDPQAATVLQGIIDQYAIDTDLSTPTISSSQNWAPTIIDKTLDLLHYCMPGQSGAGEFEGMRDHDDTLWYSALEPNLKWPHYDVVLADEVQDFNKCQTVMLQKLAQAGARVIAVGDPNQAIYMFRGADANAFQNVQTVLGGAPTGNASHELPTNYRSAPEIIDYVNKNTHVTNLRAGLKHKGTVTEGSKYDDAQATLAQEWQQNGGKMTEQTAMISRTNKPLVRAALDLMKNNMDFVIMGRDFSKELTDFVEKVAGKGRNARNIPIQNLEADIGNFVGNLEQKWAGKISKSAELKEMKDTAEALTSVLQHLQSTQFMDPKLNMQVRDSTGFLDYIKKRFAGVNMDNPDEAANFSKRDPKTFVTLTSAHRSKGLEFDRVFIVGRENFPHPKAKTAEEAQQEANAWYVALTRAMKTLHVLAPEKN